MAERPSRNRALADLCVALAIGVSLLILNIAINFNRWFHEFFSYYSAPVSDWVVNLLCIWLAVLLFVAYRRWRRTARQRSELECVVSSISPDVLLVVSPDRKISMCSSSVDRMFGYPAAELVGNQTDLVYFDRRSDHTRPHEIYEALEKDGFHIGTATGRRKDGATMPLEIISGDLSDTAGAVLVLRDISERVRADEERRAYEARIQKQQKLESLGVLARGVAHDFSNLLTVILGNAGVSLLDVPSDTPLRESLESIVATAERASGLCKQMMAYAGRGRFITEATDLNTIVQETGDLLRATVAKKAALEYDLHADVPAIDADPVQLQQVVMNLILNAADAIENGQGRIDVSTRLIEITDPTSMGLDFGDMGTGDTCVRLAVADNGCGMAEATRNRIFDPFFTTKKGGRGLGLATVMGIIRGHRAGLRVESRPGEGTTFHVYFRRADAGDE